MTKYHFPFDKNELPKNGIYIIFEKGETAHKNNRIVNVGTHGGENKLISRLNEHFIIENKDRSILRKNIGKAILNKKDKKFLEQWNWDLTSRINKDKYLPCLDMKKQKEIETEVTQYIQKNFSFVIIQEKSKDKRAKLKSEIISIVSNCMECKPSTSWLGNLSPIDKIKKSGLWLV
jgi:Fe-S cluster biosynthesis and repair protein YggX